MMYHNQKNTEAGFAMLFAVLTSSILITIGISIFNISLRELTIATAARDSQIAYYAADSAQECALYWDLKQGSFPTCLDSSCAEPSTALNNTIRCNGTDIDLSFVRESGTLTHSYMVPNDTLSAFFLYSSTSPIEPDAGIEISKTFYPAQNVIQTIIRARGHNTGVIGRRVERGVQQIYNQ